MNAVGETLSGATEVSTGIANIAPVLIIIILVVFIR